MILTRTPFRISFFGGGTDYPEWSNEHGGAVLGATINQYCWLAVRPPSRFGPRYKVIYSQVDVTDELEGIKHPAVRACLKMADADGAEIYHTSDLPARSGVGSSSAFVVGLLHALHASNIQKVPGNSITKDSLAWQATYVERNMLQETVGCQDQILTAHGGFNRIDFHPGSGYTRKVLNVRADLSDYLMLFYSGIQRTASDVASCYVNNLRERATLLRRIRGMVDDGEVILEKGYLPDFGRLLDEAWAVKRQLASGVSNGRIDMVYEAAKRAGALGGKVLGAGGGGFLLFFVPPGSQPAVRSALDGLVEVPFRFEHEGSVVVNGC